MRMKKNISHLQNITKFNIQKFSKWNIILSVQMR